MRMVKALNDGELQRLVRRASSSIFASLAIFGRNDETILSSLREGNV